MRSGGWDLIHFTINVREVSGEDGWTILEVAREHAIDIPTLCSHGTLEPSGACRLRMVEVNDRPRSREVGSRLYPLREGMKAARKTDRSNNERRGVLQKLVDEHPGSKRLLALPQLYSVPTSRFKSNISEDCGILGGLCVRDCDEAAGVRGVNQEGITSDYEPCPENIHCGTRLYVSPTEAMARFSERVRGGGIFASGAGEPAALRSRP